MGWASGGDLADDVWKAIEPLRALASPEVLEQVARDLVEAFEDQDCDTLEECQGLLGHIANRMGFEQLGAPRTPVEGDTFQDGEDAYTFNGQRWRPNDARTAFDDSADLDND